MQSLKTNLFADENQDRTAVGASGHGCSILWVRTFIFLFFIFLSKIGTILSILLINK